MMKREEPVAESDYKEGVIQKMMTAIRKIASPADRSGYSGSDAVSLPFDLNARPVFVALALMALAVGMLFLVPNVFAQDASTIEYREGGTGSVATFTADDPEGVTPIIWSLAPNGTDPDGNDGPLTVDDAADDTHFDIDKDGELTFAVGADDTSPDFEAPRGTGPASDTNTNTYSVVVVASDADTGGQMGYHKVTVKVTDVKEDGEVSWTVDHDANNTADTPKLIQFQVGAILTAIVEDGDLGGTAKIVADSHADVAANPTWRWYRSPSKTSTGTVIEGETSPIHTVTTDDVGMYLRAVTYYLVTGNVDQETASLTSDYPVLAARPADELNKLKFDPDALDRSVAEGDKGANVGAPVTATGNHGVVNYTLDGDGTDNAKFKIDQKTGQITTNVDLDYDAATADQADNCRDADFCTVTVRATDASGAATAASAAENVFEDATVTFKITDVDEKPTFSTGDKMVSVEEGTTVVDSDSDNDGEAATGASVYTATDPEGLSLTYHLMGSDGAKFELSSDRVLSFRTAPDYENPTDRGRDNVYEVTVRASDGTLHEDRMVEVTVTNDDEAPEIKGRDIIEYREGGTGSVATFTADDPEGVTPITWSLAPNGTDPDGNDGPLTVDDAADDTHFDIDKDGELTFAVGADDTSPDFEAPRGTGPASDTNTNTYSVVVVASDADADTGGQMGYRKVTVKVTDVEEDGEVSWTVDHGGDTNMPKLIQFQVGATLTAIVEDGDLGGTAKIVADSHADVAANPTWRWYRGSTLISNQETNVYIVTSTDVGSRLRVVATYRIGDSTGQETASLRSDYPVLVARPADKVNKLKFDPDALDRSVAEGDKGANVGAPVTATGNHGVVNYTLDGDGTDNAKFKIDQKTGQITTNVDLDYDAATADQADNCRDADFCTVTVRATDASGAATAASAAENVFEDATVTIKITDVDEKPTFSTGDKMVSVEEGTTVVDSDSDNDGEAATGESVYTATDPEGLNVNLTLMGSDGAKFEHSSGGVLSFRTAPDYENPTDRDRDNVYEVTLRVSDGTLHEDRMVEVTVTNDDEAPEIMITSGVVVNTPPKFASTATTRTVAEDAAVGADVGTPVEATDAGDTLSYTLGGTDAASFTINSRTGQLTTSAALDFEMKASYSVTVTATDSADASDSIEVTITVTDVDEEPVEQTLLDKYDDDDSGDIDKSEAIAAINDYLFGEGDEAITKDQAIEVINLYLFGE